MILTSAERSDSGTYTLDIFDVDGRSKGSSTLQVNIEAQVSSVKVSYSCLSPGVVKVNCAADGDNLRFSWYSDFIALPQLENGTSTVILEQDPQGKVTCHVENHFSRDQYTVQLYRCSARVSSVKLSYSCLFSKVRKVYCSADGDNLHFSWTSDSITRLEDDNRTLVLDKKHNEKVTCHVKNQVSHNHNSFELPECTDFIIVFVSVWLFEVIILLSVLVGTLHIYPRIYRKRRTPETQVSSVKVSYSCLPPGVMKVNCSADGDNLHFSWTSDFIALPQLENRTSTVILEQDHQGKVTCHVENHVSRDHNTVELLQCPALTNPTYINTYSMIVFVSVWLFEVIILLSVLVGTLYIYPRIYRKWRTPERPGRKLCKPGQG
ncbi:hypothetical protein KOW79_001861 [Hemibagrus wyckioides]|uniref:Ig-like domain-containing protein n=1 Tax=Hemibagrus wyckioides TaxID=337641 RepID=A0A9D3P8Y2_9TELE|nr:hypothetical protein KOW79_001861 [Hemibagrus wyckioides]